MKKTIFFTIALLFCGSTQGMDKVKVAEMRKFSEGLVVESGTPPKPQKKAYQPLPQKPDIFNEPHHSKELSDVSIGALVRALYPDIFPKSQQS